MVNKWMKMCPASFIGHQGNANSNPQHDTTTHPPEWLKLKRLKVLRIGRRVEEMERPYTNAACGSINWYKHSNSLAIFTKAKYKQTVGSGRSSPR